MTFAEDLLRRHRGAARRTVRPGHRNLHAAAADERAAQLPQRRAAAARRPRAVGRRRPVRPAAPPIIRPADLHARTTCSTPMARGGAAGDHRGAGAGHPRHARSPSQPTAPVAAFSLVRLSSITHSVNNDQRRIPLAFTSAGSNGYELTIPSNPGVVRAGLLHAVRARTPTACRRWRRWCVSPARARRGSRNPGDQIVAARSPAIAGDDTDRRDESTRPPDCHQVWRSTPPPA